MHSQQNIKISRMWFLVAC